MYSPKRWQIERTHRRARTSHVSGFLGPNPVSNVAPLVDTRNLTLEWPVPEGRVEWYSLRWWAEHEPARGGAQNISAPAAAAGAARSVRALLGGLQPGAPYAISIAAHSYNLTSELFTMRTRTREYAPRPPPYGSEHSMFHTQAFSKEILSFGKHPDDV